MACFLLTMRIFHCHVGLPGYIAKFSAKICPKQGSLVACKGNDTHFSMKHDYGRKRSWCWVQYCVSPYRCISYWKRWMLQRHVRRPNGKFSRSQPCPSGCRLVSPVRGKAGCWVACWVWAISEIKAPKPWRWKRWTYETMRSWRQTTLKQWWLSHLNKMQFRTCCTVRWTGSLAYLNSSKSACHSNCGSHRSHIAAAENPSKTCGNKQADRLTSRVSGLDWSTDFGFGDQTLLNIQYILYDHILFCQTKFAGWVESWCQTNRCVHRHCGHCQWTRFIGGRVDWRFKGTFERN